MCFDEASTHNVVVNNKARRAIRMIAPVVCAVYLVVALLSSAYVIAHINHKHDHDGLGGTCAICAHITAAGDFFKRLTAIAPITAVCVSGLFVISFCLKSGGLNQVANDLVSLKVRLNC